MKKAKLDFWVDCAIGAAGLVSALTGLILLLPADAAAGILGVSLRAWSTLHTWSSLAAVAGVGLHLALHWRWMTAMAGRMLASPGGDPQPGALAPAPVRVEGKGAPISRRTFLAVGGLAALATGLVAAGYKAIASAASEGSQDSSSASTVLQGSRSAATTAQAGGVACPRGLVNDPYPGQCRHYVDSDGDGICDYSVSGSGSTLAGSGGGSVGDLRPSETRPRPGHLSFGGWGNGGRP